jgi:hypothetical protein
MLSQCVRLRDLAAFAALNACGLHVSVAADAIGQPSATDIHRLEEHVRLPAGAAPIGDYVRYYYLSQEGEPRTLVGIFVDKHEFDEPSQVPSGGIVLVSHDEDVSRPWDAGCGVIHVRYTLTSSPHVTARCDPELTFSSPSGLGMFVLVALSVLLALLLAAVVWFVRWSAARKAKASGDHAT